MPSLAALPPVLCPTTIASHPAAYVIPSVRPRADLSVSQVNPWILPGYA